MTDKNDVFLEQFFEAARVDDVAPSEDLQTRVLADAAAALVQDVPERRAAFWPSLLEMFGGWPALSGVAAAGVAGLWFGLAPPAAVESLAADLLGTTTEVSFFTDVDYLIAGDFSDG